MYPISFFVVAFVLQINYSIAWNRTQVACSGSFAGGQACCGSRPMNPEKEVCFLGKVKERLGGAALAVCRTDNYDPYTQICCDGRVQTGRACCLNFGFDPDVILCNFMKTKKYILGLNEFLSSEFKSRLFQ
jgi:hypothetical protein